MGVKKSADTKRKSPSKGHPYLTKDLKLKPEVSKRIIRAVIGKGGPEERKAEGD